MVSARPHAGAAPRRCHKARRASYTLASYPGPKEGYEATYTYASMAESVAFQQTLRPENLGTCVTEVLKYVLYSNNQIPFPYEQLMKAKAGPGGTPLELSGSRAMPKMTWREKKLDERVRKLQQLLSNVHSICSKSGATLKEVVIILGGTLISPKMVYRITVLEGLVSEEAVLTSQENLKRYMVKSLIGVSLPPESRSKKLPLTNCFVLILAPRSSNFEGDAFPRMTFRVVARGSQVSLWMRGPEVGSKSTKEAMATDNKSTSVRLSSKIEAKSSGDDGTKADLVSLFEDLSLVESKEGQTAERQGDDDIWFQVSVVFQGFTTVTTSKNTHDQSHGIQDSDDFWA